MLKDSYRKKMDSVHVREDLLDDIKAERVQRLRDERQKKERRRPWMIAIPTAAAATAACVALFFGINGKSLAPASDTKTADAVAAEVSTNETVLLGENRKDAGTQTNAPETVKSYEALGEIMEARLTRSRNYYGGIADGMRGVPVAEEAVEMPAEEPAAIPEPKPADVNMASTGAWQTESDDSGKKNYSGTNNQVAGVDEADIVKTDGDWIYTLSRTNNKLYILSAQGKDTAVTAKVKLMQVPEMSNYWRSYSEMILCGDRLYLLGTHSDWSENVREQDRIYTFAEVYDLGDRTDPKLITTLKQQGDYRTARLIDNLLVIVSDYRIYSWYPMSDEIPVKEYVPKVSSDEASGTLAPGDIYVNPDSNDNGFTVVTTINAPDGREYDSHKAVLGGCSQVYCNGRDLLIAANEYESEQSDEQTDEQGKHFVTITSGSSTNLFRFTLNDGKVEAVASTKVRGTLLNQFSMDAYQGYFRLVLTRNDSKETIWTDGIDSYEWTNSSDCALIVLNGDLETVGMLDNLAKDERVQSVRFMDDTAYFVTFRQVDPLFSADLSDPENPKILGKLKIPGFSAYLHPFGEGKLLGIGYDADEEHGWTENVKLSMFDISDPADVKEAFKLSVKDVNWTSVQYNHKIVFVDVETGTVAFPADNVYLVFRAENGGFKEVGRIQTDGKYWFGDSRGLFVEDAFYVIGEQEVVILSFETMEQLAEIELN